MRRLFVSETFYSIQGEGSTSGFPAVFLRLTGCNLFCGKNDATWVCDTIPIWQKGVKKMYEEVLEEFYVEKLRQGAHLIITGGEPLLQQEQIYEYLKWFVRIYKFRPFTEIETNGTIYPILKLSKDYVDQWNCSPKLSNSGENYTDRIDKSALVAINQYPAIFKFVISDLGDWVEIQKTFLDQNIISKEKIWLMPAASTIEELLDNNQLVAKMAMDMNVRFCTRLQVEIWNKTVGV